MFDIDKKKKIKYLIIVIVSLIIKNIVFIINDSMNVIF